MIALSFESCSRLIQSWCSRGGDIDAGSAGLVGELECSQFQHLDRSIMPLQPKHPAPCSQSPTKGDVTIAVFRATIRFFLELFSLGVQL